MSISAPVSTACTPNVCADASTPSPIPASTLSLDQMVDAYLDARGISPDYARKAGVHSVTASQAALLGYPYAARSEGGILFPYRSTLDAAPRPTPSRVRYLGRQPLDELSRPVRYAVPRGSTCEAYFAPCIDWVEVMRDASTPIAITAGESSALYMNQLSSYSTPTIALAGVWDFIGKDTLRITPWLRMLLAARRTHGAQWFIAYGADMAPTLATHLALQRVAAMLSETLDAEIQGQKWATHTQERTV